MNRASSACLNHGKASCAGQVAESRRRFAVKLVFLIYALALIEGPLRKWVAADYATYLYFLRDPVVFFLYAYCIQYRIFAKGGLASNWISFAIFSTIVGILPFIFYDIDPRAWLLGVRTYWLYLPLAFIVALNFRKVDINNFLRWNVILAVPYAVLIFVQYKSPSSAWINWSISGDADAVEVAYGIIRPFGLFTYTVQNVLFTALLCASFIGYLLVKDRGRPSKILLAAGALSCASISVLTGSRAIYFMLAAILILTLIGTLLSKPTKWTIIGNIGVGVSVGLAVVLYATLFSDMQDVMLLRFDRAAQTEGSIFNRLSGEVTGFVEPLMTSPLLGHGIGTGTPAITRFLNSTPLIYGESDLMRSMNELGFFLGVIFLALRFSLSVLLVLYAYGAARCGLPMALPLAGFAAPLIAVGQITHSTLYGFLPWFVAGLVLALRRQAAISTRQVIPRGMPRLGRPRKHQAAMVSQLGRY